MDTATGSGLMEEFELMKLAKYRVYMQNIDKALKNFEYSSEWADLISALGKLNKVRLLDGFGGFLVWWWILGGFLRS
jgi:Dopey, N-terminal